MMDFKENIEQSLELLYKVEKQPSKKKALLDKPKMVFLLIGLFKLPFVPSPKKKFVRLRHSVYGDDPEICLFVPNRKTRLEYKITTDEMIDSTVNYYTDLLEKHKIKGISTVMPLKQLRSEYGTYELRRKLVRRYDLFLCKNSLLYNHRFLTALGKHFREANREPLGVSFPKEDAEFDPEFQKNIDRAICTSTFTLKRSSDNYAIPVGNLAHTKSQLWENIETTLDQLFSGKMIPGGIENVRVMYLLPYQSKPIPLFFNPDIPPKEGRPRIKGKKRKMPVGVEGELSTQPGKKVMVMPNGEVFVTKIDDKEEIEGEEEVESDDSFRDDSEDEEEVRKNEKLKTKPQKDDEESESEDDEEIEEREERLLREKREAENDPNEKSKKTEDDEDEDVDESDVEISKSIKATKPQKGKNVKKSNRKLMIKQEKFKAKEKLKQKIKSKQKKV